MLTEICVLSWNDWKISCRRCRLKIRYSKMLKSSVRSVLMPTINCNISLVSEILMKFCRSLSDCRMTIHKMQQRLIMTGNKATQEDNSRLLEENNQLK